MQKLESVYCFKLYYFQIPVILCESCVMAAARRTGKSSVLESCMLQDAINSFNAEIMLVAHRESQIDQRERSLQKAFLHIRFLTQFLLTGKKTGSIVLGKSLYEYKLKHKGAAFMGKAGEKDLGETIVGQNPIHKYVEEAGFFLKKAWDKFSKTKSVRGATERFFGTCDIVTADSPLYLADTKWDETFAHARFHIAQLLERHYSIADFRNDIDMYGSEKDPRCRNLVFGEFAAFYKLPWDIDSIRACCEDIKEVSFYKTIITGKMYENSTPDQFLSDLPKLDPNIFDKVGIGMDVGLIHTSVILFFAHHIKRDKWFLVGVVSLIQEVISDYQAEILDYVMDFYRESWAGVDITNNPAIVTTLRNEKHRGYAGKNYADRLIEVSFNKKADLGWEVDPKTKNLPPSKRKYIKKEAEMKVFTIDKLNNIFKKKGFVLPKEFEDDLIEDFQSERESISMTTGKTTIRTPENVHIPEAFRCFVLALHEKGNSKEMPQRPQSEFCAPEVGRSVWE